MMSKRFSSKDEVYSLVSYITDMSQRLDYVEVLDFKVKSEQVNDRPFHEIIMPVVTVIAASNCKSVSLELQLNMVVNDGTPLADLPQKVLEMLQARHFSVRPRRPVELDMSHSLNFKSPQCVEDFFRMYEGSDIPLKSCPVTASVWVDYQNDKDLVVQDLMEALSNGLDPAPLHVVGRELFNDKVRGEFLDSLIGAAINKVENSWN